MKENGYAPMTRDGYVPEFPRAAARRSMSAAKATVVATCIISYI